MIPDHVLRAAGLYEWSTGPSFTLAGDSLVYSGPLPEVNKKTAYYASCYGSFSFIKNILLNFQQNARFKRVSVQDYQKAYVMIRNMSRYAKATGGDFLLLFWEQFALENDPNGHFAPVLGKKLDELQKDGVNLIRVSDIIDTRDPRYTIFGDGHPNALAYDTVARYLAKYLPTAFPSYR